MHDPTTASPGTPATPATPASPGSARLLQLWQSNADAWTHAVRSAAIESRRVATDAAVIEAVLAQGPRRVLDVGCGEGWLTRALVARGLAARGLEAIPRLVEAARAVDQGDYAVAAFDDLAGSPLAEGFDLWVCNFSLFHERDAPTLLAAARRHLPAGGSIVIQTLHASATPGGSAEPDGWQPGGWGPCGSGSGFGEPIPWFFRTLPSWRALFPAHGFADPVVREPAHPETGRPLSWLFVARSS